MQWVGKRRHLKIHPQAAYPLTQHWLQQLYLVHELLSHCIYIAEWNRFVLKQSSSLAAYGWQFHLEHHRGLSIGYKTLAYSLPIEHTHIETVQPVFEER